MPNEFGSSTWDNPLAYLYNTYEGKTNNLVLNTNLSYLIFPGLEIRSNFGYNNIQSRDVQLNPLTAVRPENKPFFQRYAVYGK